MFEVIISALIGGFSGAIIAQFTSVFDKSKIFFEKKLQALSEMHNLVEEMRPKNQMAMDWDDACEHLAHIAEHIGEKFSEFRKKFSAALTDEELKSLDRALKLARDTSLSLAKDDPQPPDFSISRKTINMAKDMWTEISNLENKIRSSVLSQAKLCPTFSKCWGGISKWCKSKIS